jgi:hypothetical protein
MSRSLVTVLSNPEAFFRDLISEKASLKIPGLIILASGIIGAISAYLIAGLTGRLMGSLMAGMDTIFGISAAIFTIIFMFVVWVILTGVFFLVSSFFKGQGSFTRCLEVVGYGSLPQVFSSLIAAIISLVYIPNITVPSLSSSAMSDPEAIRTAMNALMQDAAMVEFRQISTLISIVFLLWSAHIWIYGMKEARALSMRDAALCVGIPVIIYVAWQVISMTWV